MKKELSLTHLDKIYFKEDHISKGELLEYYAKMAPFILPYLHNRPLVLHRYPGGLDSDDFYQKEAGPHLPPFVKTVKVAHETKEITYIMAQDVETLLYVVNLGSIELHPFSASIKHLDEPDYLIIDLDPHGVTFDVVIEIAQAIHDLLESLEAPHFCKTSGKAGLHIFLPLNGKYSFDVVRQMAFLLCTIIHKAHLEVTSLERSPDKRHNKLYLDYLQNRQKQTMVAAYSVRGTPHATVSTPLLWKEVKKGLDPAEFTIQTVPARMDKIKDPFKGVLEKGLNLKNLLKKAEKLI